MKKRWAILRWVCTAGLVLCLTLWIGSAWYLLEFETGHQLTAQFGRGVVVFINQDSPLAADSNRLLPGVKFGRLVSDFDWWFNSYHDATGLRTLKVPLWTLVAIFAGFSLGLWRSRVRECRTPRISLCPKCNYSLAGLPPDSPCPECGPKA